MKRPGTLRACLVSVIVLLCALQAPVRAQTEQADSAAEILRRLDAIDSRLDDLRPDSRSWWDYLVSHDWVDPGTFYFVLGLGAFGIYRLRRAQQDRRYEYVTYVLNVPLRCHDGRVVPDHLLDGDRMALGSSDHEIVASHGLVTGILREDKFESALGSKQLGQLDAAVRAATKSGFLPLNHDMFAMFRTEISEIFNHYFMAWERTAKTFESAVFRKMYFSVLFESYTDRKHIRILIIPADRLSDLPQDEAQDERTIIRTKKLASRLPNLRFMRDEMQRVESGEIDASRYVRAFEIMEPASRSGTAHGPELQ